MKVEIFDVDHGACAFVTTPEGQTILMDCGSSSGSLLTSWYPGQMLAARGIRHVGELVVSHADEDHVSGLKSIDEANIGIGWIATNPTLTPQIIRALKPDAPGPAVSLFLQRLASQQMVQGRASTLLTGMPTSPSYSIGKHAYWCIYSPSGAIQDINNMSLVTFLFCGGLRMVFPGDLEAAGWRVLLGLPDFRNLLAQVNVFVASHHGRQNGFCAEVFNVCKPDLIVFSDSSMVHDTQQTAGVYGRYANGIFFDNGVKRYVLTTRNNGHITFQTDGSAYRVNLARA